MRKALFDWAKSAKGMITIAVSLSFVFGTMGLTLVQAASYDRSAVIEIYEGPELVVTLFIHHWQVLPNHAMFHATLKFTNNYDEDITVDHIEIESWSCPKSGCPVGDSSPGLFMYAEDSTRRRNTTPT
jgi:hypothetical protein